MNGKINNNNNNYTEKSIQDLQELIRIANATADNIDDVYTSLIMEIVEKMKLNKRKTKELTDAYQDAIEKKKEGQRKT